MEGQVVAEVVAVVMAVAVGAVAAVVAAVGRRGDPSVFEFRRNGTHKKSAVPSELNIIFYELSTDIPTLRGFLLLLINAHM
jgi:hypothetical protein